VSLKSAVERQLNIPVRVRAGALGALDVYVDGEQIYSKKRTGRIPTATEVIELIRARLP
jgi:selT/selW/selH-like putative selenoprotein